MTINPREYDPDELRRAVRDELDDRDIAALRETLTSTDASGSSVADGPLLKELLLLESGIDPETLARPYLETIPDRYAGRLTTSEWLDYLLETAGVRRTLEAIEYYARVGWVSESVAEDLREHVRAFEAVSSGGTRELEPSDHVVSLVYVARLTSMVG